MTPETRAELEKMRDGERPGVDADDLVFVNALLENDDEMKQWWKWIGDAFERTEQRMHGRINRMQDGLRSIGR